VSEIPRLRKDRLWFFFCNFLLRDFLLIVGLFAASLQAATAEPRQLDKLAPALEKLWIVSASGSHDFEVEVMRSDAERAKGLMFRRFLPENRGMLFDFKHEEPVMMWMKNTYLPLDMIFMSKTGMIVGLAENTEPLSEKIIPSGAPAFAVLEVNAGTVAKLHMKIGDVVHHGLFGN
jgi:uncharacterized membrane protein (UPF0127 family)